MAAMIKGISVTLYEQIPYGKDPFGAELCTERPKIVENVLVYPVSTVDTVTDLQLYGKKAEYELCIPKGDDHSWEDAIVEFFGQRWRTFGFVTEYIEANLPLDWNRKVKVERYG